MTLADLKEFIIDNCHFNVADDASDNDNDYDIQIADDLFSGGWDYFVMVDNEGVTFFPKLVAEGRTGLYSTIAILKDNQCESIYEWSVPKKAIDISEDKVLEYIQIIEMELKRVREEIKLNEIQKDF